MPIHIPTPACLPPAACPAAGGCPPCVCPDLVLRRHDTKPPFRVSLTDCDGPVNMEGLVLEANMWARGRLRKALPAADTDFQFADQVGFNQVMVDDIIVMDRARKPEHMLVTGFDEDLFFVRVRRGYNGTTPSAWRKAAPFRVFRVLNSPAVSELVFEDHEEVDGTVTRNVLAESFLVYEWRPEDTCLPGCYWLEFKLLKMKSRQFFLPGGRWVGLVHADSGGSFRTGEFEDDGSVLVSLGLGDPYDVVHKVLATVPADAGAHSPLPDPSRPQSPYPQNDFQWQVWQHLLDLYPYADALRWEIWDRIVHLYPAGNYYVIPNNVHWEGPVHQWSDSNWYTGTSHTSGSVYLDANGVVTQPTASYNETGLVSMLCAPVASVVPSFTSVSQSPADYDCGLGVGVEWVRRYPSDSEGFLISISDSPTAERQ